MPNSYRAIGLLSCVATLQGQQPLPFDLFLYYITEPYFACKAKAMVPDSRGVEALVPVNSSVHRPFSVVVLYIKTNSLAINTDSYSYNLYL